MGLAPVWGGGVVQGGGVVPEESAFFLAFYMQLKALLSYGLGGRSWSSRAAYWMSPFLAAWAGRVQMSSSSLANDIAAAAGSNAALQPSSTPFPVPGGGVVLEGGVVRRSPCIGRGGRVLGGGRTSGSLGYVP